MHGRYYGEKTQAGCFWKKTQAICFSFPCLQGGDDEAAESGAEMVVRLLWLKVSDVQRWISMEAGHGESCKVAKEEDAL